MAKVFIAEVVLKLIDNMTGPMQKASRQVSQHTNAMTAEFKKLERGVGTFIGAFAGIGVVTREMSRLTEVMKDYSRVQQQILSLNVRPDPRPRSAGRLMGDMGSTEYFEERKKLDQRALELSKRYNVSPTAVLDEIMALKQAGISLAGSRLAAGPLVALARVTGIKDTNELTRQVVGAATEFRLPMGTVPRPGQKVADIESSTLRMANIMLYLRSKNVTPQEMLEATKYAGSLSATVGGTPESFAATLGGLAQRQVTGTMAGTVLRSDVNRLLQMTEGKFKAGAKALEKYGGVGKFVTEVPVTGARLKAAMETQFGVEAGGKEPTAAEWDRLAKMNPVAREEAMRKIASEMAPQSYFQGLQASPDMITRQLELANLQASKFVNLTGVWKDGKWIPGAAEAIGGDLGTMGTVFEGRHLNRNIALAQSAPMIREMLKRGKGGIPEDLMAEALKIINDIDAWESAFTKLQNSIERAFVRFSGSAVGKAILHWIDTLSTWIDDISERFEKMPAGEQWKTFSAALTGFMLFVGDIIKIVGDILSGDSVKALSDITTLGAKLTAGAAAFDATGKMGGSLGDQMMAGVTAAFASQIVGDVLGKIGSYFGIEGLTKFTGTLVSAGGITAGMVMLPKLWDYTKKIFHPTAAGLPDPAADALAGLGIDPNKTIDLTQVTRSTGGALLAWIMGGKAVPRPASAGPNFPSPYDKSYEAFKYFGLSAPDLKQPGRVFPPGSFDESRLEKHDEMLADMIDKNAVEVSAGFKNLPPALKKAFLESLQEWSGGNPGMAPGGVNGFGFGIGGTQLGGAGMGGIGAGGFRGGQFGGGQGALSENGKAFMRRLIDKWHFSPASAAIAAGQVDWESAGFQPGISGDQGKSHGYGQWNGRRWAQIVALAGGKWPDKDLQTDFYAQEWIKRGLSTTEKDFSHFHQLGHAMEGYRYGPTAHEGDRIARGQKWLDWISGKGDSGSMRGVGPLGAFGSHGGVSMFGGQGLNPGFASRLAELQRITGIHFRIQPGQGYRSFQQQLQIWRTHHPAGRPGARPGQSYHNFGRAGDLQHEDGTPLTMSELIALGRAAPQVGLTWGGTFRNRDPAHFQWGPPGGAGWILRQQQGRQSRIDVHIHDDGIRMAAKGDVPIRANYRGKRMAETGRSTWRG